MSKVKIQIPGGNGEFLRMWAEHLGVTVKETQKYNFELQAEDPAKFFWLGINMGSGLRPPQKQTRKSNLEFIKNHLGEV